MSVLQFIASLAGSLAWPAVVLVVALVFRKQLAALIGRPLSSLKAGMFHAVWDREVADLSPNTADQASARPSRIRSDLTALALVNPTAAVEESFARLESDLRQKLADAGLDSERGTVMDAARTAEATRLIPSTAVNAIESLATLRNLALHGHGNELDAPRAREFILLTDSISYVLKQSPPSL